MANQKIILFTEHFNVRHVVDRLHLEKSTLERALNSDANQKTWSWVQLTGFSGNLNLDKTLFT